MDQSGETKQSFQVDALQLSLVSGSLSLKGCHSTLSHVQNSQPEQWSLRGAGPNGCVLFRTRPPKKKVDFPVGFPLKQPEKGTPSKDTPTCHLLQPQANGSRCTGSNHHTGAFLFFFTSPWLAAHPQFRTDLLEAESSHAESAALGGATFPCSDEKWVIR